VRIGRDADEIGMPSPLTSVGSTVPLSEVIREKLIVGDGLVVS